LANHNSMRRIGAEPTVITWRNNVIPKRYWTPRQERVKLVDYRASGRFRFGAPNRLMQQRVGETLDRMTTLTQAAVQKSL
jgi:hypothetical protein